MQQEAKYIILTNWIKDQIIKNNLRYGERFFSEKELSSRFELSRHTVRKAVGILEHEGFLERRRGSGTYVIYGQKKSVPPPRASELFPPIWTAISFRQLFVGWMPSLPKMVTPCSLH